MPLPSTNLLRRLLPSRRKLINVDLHPSEVHHLIRWHETRATAAADNPELDAVADALLTRAAELREAAR